MNDGTYLPVFATNDPAEVMTVAGEVSRMLRALRTKYRQPPDVAISTAYINPAGFDLLADELERAPRVRLLLGAEPEQDAVRAIVAHDADTTERLDRAVASHEQWLTRERDTMGFEREADARARRMVGWLRSTDTDGHPRVQVRRYVEGFLHGKAFISDDPEMPAVLAGSSNMTYAGLAFNAELNLGYPAGDTTHAAKVIQWFNRYWDGADDYDLAALYERQWQPHTPWTVFLRMLWELYGAELDEEKAVDTELHLTPFQADGVARMERLLGQLGGVLVADEVGLGKTYLAAEVIHHVTETNRQRVLVICPASLKKAMWEPFLHKHGFRLTDVYSYEEIRNRMEPDDPGHRQFAAQADDYSMVVVDEAHNLRNAAAARSEAVDRVILGGEHPKKVMLLTATPVNNSLTDLETLIKYFVRDDAHFASIGIPSIHAYIRKAQALDPENLTPEHLFDLMDQVAVRRTRRFVKDQYPGVMIEGPDGRNAPLQFPQPSVYRIDYTHDAGGLDLVDAVVYAIERREGEDLYSSYRNRKQDPDRLTLARYTTSGYLLSENLEAYQLSNAGLLRSALLKRLESSPRALASTLATLIDAHWTFLEALDQGFVLRGDALREWASSDSDDLADFLDGLEEGEDHQAASLFHAVELREDVQSDLELLERLHALAEARCNEHDLKAQRLIDELSHIAKMSETIDPRGVPSRDRRKVIVFSTYSDTIVDLHERVSRAVARAPEGSPLALYRGRVAPPIMGAYTSVHKAGKSGGIDQGGRANTIEGFAPETAGSRNDQGRPTAQDRYDVLLTTDVLAEGVNLQQAGRILNYDLPWNPQRIVQRHGRVDRIGSKHDIVRLGLFFPSQRLDELLRLEETLERKLAQAEAAVGGGAVLPGRVSSADVVLTDGEHAVDQIQGLLETRGAGAALSGEEYRRRLFNAFMQNALLRSDAQKLPYGSGSGFVNPGIAGNAYVFCVRVNDQPKPWFRLVSADVDWSPALDETGRPLVSDDTLSALTTADPSEEGTPRWMTDQVYDRAFDSWQVAQRSVHDTWERMTDPNNLQPDVPKSFLDAYRLVVNKGGFLPDAERTVLLRRLRGVPSVKVSRAVRSALSDPDSTDRQRVLAVKGVLEEAGIEPPPPVEPLPDVSLDEVRLVAWMAVKGKDVTEADSTGEDGDTNE